MSSVNKVLLLAVAVLLVVLVTVTVWQFVDKEPNFHAVYLTGGDLYFGKLVKFPSYGLKQVYILQVDPENQETPINVQRFRDIFWDPNDYIKLNRDHVIWTVKLNSKGQLADLIRNNPDLIPNDGASGGEFDSSDSQLYSPDFTEEFNLPENDL